MSKRLILPIILLLALVGVILYVGGTPWVELRLLTDKPTEITQNSFAMSQQAAILALAAAVIGIVLLWSLIMWLWHLPTRLKTGMGRRREHSGIEALEQALIAGEAGDGTTARRKAKKAHELLSRPALTGLISARALETAGQAEDAEAQYRALLDDEATAIAGYRGLARLAEQNGDYATVESMTKAACEVSPPPAWALQLLFRAEVQMSDWDGALDALSRIEKHKIFGADGIKRRRAALLSAKAAAQEKAGDQSGATDTALKAAEAAPGFAPASALAARLLLKSGNIKRASSVIEKAWRNKPHPALSQAYLDLFSDEPDAVLEKKIKTLVKTNPDHRESAILIAEHKLTVGDGAAALQALGSVLRDEDPSVRVALLAASIEEALGNAVDAGAWRGRAESAPLEADWSDLDPDGPAFDYTEADWQNLIISYGETGMLLHPRFGARQQRRGRESYEAAPISESPNRETPAPPNPDNPGVIKSTKPDDDLSKRLENLLGDPE